MDELSQCSYLSYESWGGDSGGPLTLFSSNNDIHKVASPCFKCCYAAFIVKSRLIPQPAVNSFFATTCIQYVTLQHERAQGVQNVGPIIMILYDASIRVTYVRATSHVHGFIITSGSFTTARSSHPATSIQVQ